MAGGNEGNPAGAQMAVPPYIYRIRIVRTESEFDALETVWDSLVDRSDGTVFQTYEWLRTWWKYFKNRHDLHIIVFECEKTVVGIAPLCRQRKKLLGIPVARQLQFIGFGLSDYLSFIIAAGHESGVLNRFAGYLVEKQSEWDVLDLTDIRESSNCMTMFPDILAENGLPVYKYQGTVSPRINLPSSYGELLEKLGSSRRYNLKRKQKKLESNYATAVDLVRSQDDDIEEAVNMFSEIHGGRWKSQGHPSAFDDPHHRSFHVDVCKRFARRGWLRLYFLRVEGKRIAQSFNFNFRSTIYMYQSNAHAADDVMKCSPGLLVRSWAIQEGIREGMRVFDFLRGSEGYKYREWNAFDNKNWLLRTSSLSNSRKSRFLFFLAAELISKAGDRVRREYFEFRRFRASSESAVSTWKYLWTTLRELGKLLHEFFVRHGLWPDRRRK